MAKRMVLLPIASSQAITGIDTFGLQTLTKGKSADIQRGISQRNAQFFEAEAAKLDGWADDLKVTLERDIKEMDRIIKEAKRAATIALTLEEKLAGQKQVKQLESQRNEKRRKLFDAQDEIDHKRGDLIAEIEGKLKQDVLIKTVFAVRWVLV